MKPIDFYNKGYDIFPIKGKLERLENGEKTEPKLPKDWPNKQFKAETIKNFSLCGIRPTNIIALDCDNNATFEMFKTVVSQIDESKKLVFRSVGKPNGGGTIVLKKPLEFTIESFRYRENNLALDFYSTSGFIYAPTADNKTKEQISSLPHVNDLAEPTEQLIILLNVLKSKKEIVIQNSSVEDIRQNYIALKPLVSEFVALDNPDSLEFLLKKLTPQTYKDTKTFTEKGYIHPSDIQKGERNNYLSKVSAILGADESIDKETYLAAMVKINDLLPTPLQEKELFNCIINPMINGKAKINNIPIWRYNKNWKKSNLIIETKDREYLYVFYDSVRMLFYAVNLTEQTIREFRTKQDLFTFLDIASKTPIQRKSVERKMELVRVLSKPNKGFDFYSKNGFKYFNRFKRTLPLEILQNPDNHNYNEKPTYTIQYFKSLIPDEKTRDYVLRFILTKLTTFKYSPIILYFLGTSGSGKDLFVQWLSWIVSNDAIAKPSVKEFLEQYNSWLLDKIFVQLDEYGDKVSRLQEKKEILGQLKTYSGSPTIQIRPMRQTGYNYNHNITYILTANKNPLILDEYDRRIVLIDTPNRLDEQPFIQTIGGTEGLVTKLKEELPHFMTWLAKNYKQLPSNEYTYALKNITKQKQIIAKLDGVTKIVYLLRYGLFDELNELFEFNDIPLALQNAEFNLISEITLYELYLALTDNKGEISTLRYQLKNAEFARKRIGDEYYWTIPGLAKWYSKQNGDVNGN